MNAEDEEGRATSIPSFAHKDHVGVARTYFTPKVAAIAGANFTPMRRKQLWEAAYSETPRCIAIIFLSKVENLFIDDQQV